MREIGWRDGAESLVEPGADAPVAGAKRPAE